MPQDGAVILSFVTPDKRDPDYRRFFSHVTVEYKEADGAAVVYQGPVNPADTLIDGLKNGVYYTFTVKVVDKNGVISDGVSVGATPVDTTVPSGVSELTLKRGLKSVTLMWLTPTKQGITAVRIHTVRLSDFYPTGTQTVAVREGYYSEFRITGLENDVTYRFFVSAIDGYGNVSSPVCIDGTPDGDAPGEPEEVEISALSGEGYENGGAVRIRWFIPRIGGTEIDDYDYTEIVYGRRGYVPDIKVDQEVRGETVDGFYRETVEVTGLQNGIEYAFRLTVYDTAGNSSSGLFVYAVPFSSFKPEALSAEPLVTRFEEQALISWKTPDSAAGVCPGSPTAIWIFSTAPGIRCSAYPVSVPPGRILQYAATVLRFSPQCAVVLQAVAQEITKHVMHWMIALECRFPFHQLVLRFCRNKTDNRRILC